MIKELLEGNFQSVLKVLANATEKAYVTIEDKIKKLGYNSIDDYVAYEENNNVDPKVEKIFVNVIEKIVEGIKIPEKYCDVPEWASLDDIKPFLNLKKYNEDFMEVVLDEICSYFGCESN